jgi:formamidopyrimidine-DNA glycosylase
MPELPDVETFRRTLDGVAVGRRVESVSVMDDRILDDVSVSTLRRRLRAHRLERSRRHGKYLFAELDDGRALVMHFGMTGLLARYDDPEQRQEHDRVLLGLDDGAYLAFRCQRLFGRVGVTDDAAAFIRDRNLGPDALDVDRDEFLRLLDERRGTVKGALMDQSLVAGIGNVYSDEILFQARIHPRTSIKELEEKERAHLYEVMREVLETAIEVHADPDRMPKNWLTPRRHMDADCPRCGGTLRRLEISGRHSYACRRCQKRPGH